MRNVKPKVLYVEDDLNLSFVTRDNLEDHNFDITSCIDGKEALKAFGKDRFDLCVLDVMLPEMDGFTLAQHIRELNPEVPIIFLTAKSMKEDKIQGLKIGGDDYVTKPFNIEELVLRMEVFLKRNKISDSFESAEQQYEVGKYTFDFSSLTLKINDNEQQLTLKEAELLRHFCENKGGILKRETILTRVWGKDDYFLGRSLDVFISRLRKYLREDERIKIENIHGVGFRLEVKS